MSFFLKKRSKRNGTYIREKKTASIRSIINPIFYFDLFLIHRHADIILFEKEAKKQN